MLDFDQLKQDRERLATTNTQKNNDYLDSFVPMPEKAGVVTVRILGPAAPGMFDRKKSPFYQATRIHRVNGKSLHCLREQVDKKFLGKCPICEYYSWLWKESENKPQAEKERLQALARSLKPTERYYLNAIVRKATLANGEVIRNVGPKILSIGKTLFQQILTAILGNEEMETAPLGDITDEHTGRDFKIVKTMKGQGSMAYPEYSQSVFLEPSSLGDPDQVKAWKEGMHDLVALRRLLPMDELKDELKIHLGVKKDKASDFDPSEYQSGGSTIQKESVSSTPVSHPAASELPISNVSDQEESESLEDDDFISSLQNKLGI